MGTLRIYKCGISCRKGAYLGGQSVAMQCVCDANAITELLAAGQCIFIFLINQFD